MKYGKTRSFLFLWMMICVLCLPAAIAWAEDGGTVSGCAYVDANQNGVCDGGEQLMAGAPVYLERLVNREWVPMNNQQQTDGDQGTYRFTGLEAGTYRVVCALEHYRLYAAHIGGTAEKTDLGLCCSAAFSLAQGQTVQMDIGLRSSAQISLSVLQGQKGVAGAVLTLHDGSRLTTGQDGTASLYLCPGDYTLHQLTLPQGYTLTQDSPAGRRVTLSDGESLDLSVNVQQAGSLSGMVFEDMNNNGLLDEGEPGVAGVQVHLEGKKTGVSLDVTTGEDGLYCFDGLADDTYTITAEPPQGMLYARYSQTGGDLRSIFSGATRQRQYLVKKAAQVTNKNIGLVQRGAIRGMAFLDLNYNGVMDEGEPGYEGVTLEAIKISNGESLGKTVTGKDGSFVLENLRGGDYRLRAILPDDGSIFTVTTTGTADQGNRFEQKNGRRESSVQPLSIVSGGEAYALVGVARGAAITGTVFEDADYNGVLNGSEKAISGLKVQAVDENGSVVATASTGAKGRYTLSGILPGTYTVQVQRKKNYGFTRVRDGEKGGNHVIALEGEWGVTAPMTVAMGESYTDVNAGMLPSSTVSGQLFMDSNDNGQWDENEPGMTQAQVRLYSQEAEIDLTQPVQADGSYFFDGVMPGTYTLTYVLPPHCEMARTPQGGAAEATVSLKVAMGEKATVPPAGAVELGTYEGIAFHDANGNGVMDAGEEPVSGVTLALTPDRSSASRQEATTGADGRFSIQGLRPAAYALTAAATDGMIFSHSPDGDGVIWPAAQQAAIDQIPWAALTNRTQKALGLVKPASIRGEIWMDENQDGAQGQEEWIMTGLTVTLSDSQGVAATVQTDESGFLFENVRPGEYTVSFSLPSQASPAGAGTFSLSGTAMRQQSVTVTEGQRLSGLNAGLVSRTSIGGKAYLDENGTRQPVEGVTVTLMLDGRAAATTVTGEDGSYRFDGLWPGQYVITASKPEGLIFMRPDDEMADANALKVSEQGESAAITLEMAQHQLNCNILYLKPAKVGDLAWLDENANGLLDGDEKRLPGITVTLVQDGRVQYETTTDAYGYYQFADVYPGSYVLVAHADAALTPTAPVPELRIISSCLTSGDGETAQSDPFEVVSGSDNRNFDLGYVLRDGQQLPESMAQPAPGRNWLRTQE